MFKILWHWIANIVIIYFLASIFPEFKISDIFQVAIFTIVLSLLNWLVVPLVRLISFPVTFITFGLFNIVITLTTVLVALNLTKGVTISEAGFAYFILLAILTVSLSLGNTLISNFVK